ncbi:MAG: hypothetical protein ABW216_10605 [Candidatus Rokuibacteriota bacterium]|jgi:hypothetical protein
MPKTPKKRADDMKRLINDGVALQIELLGASVQVWSAIFESMASYTKTASEELLQASAKGDANAALDKVIDQARTKLDSLMKLPEDIGKNFRDKVRARAKN